MQQIVRAIDVGYGNVKFVTGRDTHGNIQYRSFPSVALAAGEKTMGGGHVAERNTVTVPFEGREYEVGDDVLMSVTSSTTRVLDANYTKSDRYQILVRGALAMMGLPRIDLLVLGAPVNLFVAAKDHLRSAFAVRMDVGVGATVEIGAVSVVPQPLGGLVAFAAEHPNLAQLREQVSLVIDPGYFTLDWLVAKRFVPIPARSGSAPCGMSAVVRALAAEVAKRTGGNPNNLAIWDRIDRALYAGEPLRINGHPYDLAQHAAVVKDVVSEAVQGLAAGIGDPEDIDNVVMVGGGAKLFAAIVRKALPRHAIYTIESPAYANVRGFQLLGEGPRPGGK